MTQPGQQTRVTDTTQKLITQFQAAVDAQNQARTAAESTEAALASRWGGQASSAYRAALANWTMNLDRVRSALYDLQGAMSQHAQLSDTAEDDNLQSVNVVSQQVAASASWTGR